jgi:Transcriptional activator of glycolytic enzymes
VTLFSMKTKHRYLKSMYNEWFGLGEFDVGMGGVHGRNQIHGAKWRRHINDTQYSRTKRVVQAIQKLAKDSGMSDEEAVEHFQPLYEESKTGLCKMNENLVKLGLLKQGKSRKRKASAIQV